MDCSYTCMPSMNGNISDSKRFSHTFRKVLDRLRNISYYNGKTDISTFRCERELLRNIPQSLW